jgi:hypothetical protein
MTTVSVTGSRPTASALRQGIPALVSRAQRVMTTGGDGSGDTREH